jgi:TatD DNase family protein
MWLDSHCHLTADAFAADRDAVMERAHAAGVEAFIAIGSGYGVANNARAVELAARDPRVFATVGVHPHEAKEWDEHTRARLLGWLAEPRVVAIGECGLDYHYMHSERAAQRAALAAQLELAREQRLPVSIHVRGEEHGACDELLEIWRSEAGDEIEGVLHCFTGSLDFARRALDARLYVSFSGILTFKRDRGLREVAAALPLARLLIETDAPLLAPEGMRGRRNEPAWLERIGNVLASAQHCTPADVALATTRNARRLFRLPAPEDRPDAA